MSSLEELLAWRNNTPDLPAILIDYHRLQIEYFVWSFAHRAASGARVLDIGVEYRKPYLKHLGKAYITLNQVDPTQQAWMHPLPNMQQPDMLGSIHDLPLGDNTQDYVLCTEVFEHVEDPFKAMREIHRVLKPGGQALLTSPFMWPWHGQSHYGDFWRITADGWRVLCKPFTSTRVYPQLLHPDSHRPLGELMAAEFMGDPEEVRVTTGYSVRAVK